MSVLLVVPGQPFFINVYQIMHKPAMTVEANMDIGYCARLFERFKLSTVPVVENGKLVGVANVTRMIVEGIRK